MSRLIDADKLIETIKQHHYMLADRLNSLDWGMFTIGIEQAIQEQPTVNEWIPVSERLPEYNEIVLLKIKNGEDYWYDNIVNKLMHLHINKFTHQQEEYITTGMLIHELNDVIAWMPIPEYKENTDERGKNETV